jgi:dipeptide transport system substrate-binding protein
MTKIYQLTRRAALVTASAAVASTFSRLAVARPKESIVMGWPVDPQTWDPNTRTTKALQSLYKMVFNQPIDQAPDQSLIPGVVKAWHMSDDGKTLELDLREDVVWHDGRPMTSADFRFTFLERPRSGPKIDLTTVWSKLADVDTPSPTRAIFKLNDPMPSAVSWLAFLANFVIPKHYFEQVGADEFSLKPLGSGPYKLVEYARNARAVLEAFDGYWGPKPAIKRVTVLFIKDPSARVAMIQAGQADFMPEIPVRDAVRLGTAPGLKSQILPISRVDLLMIRSDRAFADKKVRLAAHHAIDKQALSQAFFAGKAKPLSIPATPGTPGYVPGYEFAYDPGKARELLAKSGFGPDKPVKIGLATFNGIFASDYDMARAIAQMWKKVGIEAEIEVIENTMYYELNRSNKLPEATLNDWDNAVGDPEMFSGYMLNPKLPFSTWKNEDDVGKGFQQLFTVVDPQARIDGYQKANVLAVEEGAIIPLLQAVGTMAYKSDLRVKTFQNGWLLPQMWSFT